MACSGLLTSGILLACSSQLAKKASLALPKQVLCTASNASGSEGNPRKLILPLDLMEYTSSLALPPGSGAPLSARTASGILELRCLREHGVLLVVEEG